MGRGGADCPFADPGRAPPAAGSRRAPGAAGEGARGSGGGGTRQVQAAGEPAGEQWPCGGAPSPAGGAVPAAPGAANFQGPLAALLESQPQSEDDRAAGSRQVTKALFPDPSKGPEASAEEKEEKLARQLSGQVLHSL